MFATRLRNRAPPGYNVIGGTSGDDTLTGTAGDGHDTVFGGLGSDYIVGGNGNDTLVGDLPGAGENPFPPSTDGSPHTDRCVGSAGTDTSFLCEVNASVESVQ